MSVFYCDSCDKLVDSDEAPEFEYDENTREWKCESCIERDDEAWIW
jgi:DNA-directed RNA polymerase subunit RPC12/RpoP